MSRTIWILNHYAITPDMAGGTRHYDLGRELVKRGYEVTVFASGFNHATKRYIKLRPGETSRTEDWQGVRFIWLKTMAYSGNDWRRIGNMISYAMRAVKTARGLKKPDVVIGSCVHPFAVAAGWWLARKYQACFIFEVRDLWPQTIIDMGALKPTSLPARLLYAWEKFMYQKAERIIVLLPNAVEYIKGRGIDPEKIVWIPNGVDLERFDHPDPLDPSSEAAAAFARHRDKFKVVYAGAHGPANGLEVVLEAAVILAWKYPDIHFFLVGDGIEKQNLCQKAQQQALNNITFLNPIPKSQLPSLLKEADALLFCLKPLQLYKYGISLNKLHDYLASKKPIIMSGYAFNNVVQEVQAGFTVAPGDARALAEAVIKLHNMMPEERSQLGANGRSFVEEHHSMEKLGAKLAQVMESTVSGRRNETGE